jgi:hypothetical protein
LNSGFLEYEAFRYPPHKKQEECCNLAVSSDIT